MSVEQLNQLLGFGTLALLIATAVLFVAYVFRNRVEVFSDVIQQVGAYALPTSFLLALCGSAMTLFYSEILGFAPCPLCWWQRVFLYPQVVLIALAMWKKDSSVWLSSICLSILGLGVALYHHALQMLPAGSLPCPAVGESCAKITILEFGFITFPMMAVALFAFLIVAMLALRNRQTI